MTFPFWVVSVPGLPAETTFSCPSETVGKKVANFLRSMDTVPVIFFPGEEILDEVACHVVKVYCM